MGPQMHCGIVQPKIPSETLRIFILVITSKCVEKGGTEGGFPQAETAVLASGFSQSLPCHSGWLQASLKPSPGTVVQPASLLHCFNRFFRILFETCHVSELKFKGFCFLFCSTSVSLRKSTFPSLKALGQALPPRRLSPLMNTHTDPKQ